MKKLLLYIVIIFFSTSNLKAQEQVDQTGANIQNIANSLLENDTLSIRLQLDSAMTQALWVTLSSPNSFQFTLDALQFIRINASPDGNLKLFTWQVALNDGHYLQKGFIQYKDQSGKIHLYKLNALNESIENADTLIGSQNNWIGAVYYDLIENEFEGKTYYTLLGFDAFDNNITKKVIEVLYFENGVPIFGGDFFEYPSDDTFPEAPVKRFIVTYKKGSNALVKYEQSAKAIFISELASTANNLKEKSTLVPTGDEVYFIWKNGKWRMRK